MTYRGDAELTSYQAIRTGEPAMSDMGRKERVTRAKGSGPIGGRAAGGRTSVGSDRWKMIGKSGLGGGRQAAAVSRSLRAPSLQMAGGIALGTVVFLLFAPLLPVQGEGRIFHAFTLLVVWLAVATLLAGLWTGWVGAIIADLDVLGHVAMRAKTVSDVVGELVVIFAVPPVVALLETLLGRWVGRRVAFRVAMPLPQSEDLAPRLAESSSLPRRRRQRRALGRLRRQAWRLRGTWRGLDTRSETREQ